MAAEESVSARPRRERARSAARRARLDGGAAWRAWRAYANAPPVVRAFLAARLTVLPLRALAPELASLEGRVLSIGCGHGLVERCLIEVNPDVDVAAVEIEPERVRVAATGFAGSPQLSVRQGDATRLDGDGGFDGALAIDVLHHAGPEDQAAMARGLARSLRPGGVCVVKDIATTPRWQHAFNWAHDRVVMRTDPIHCRAPTEMAAMFAEAGFRLQAIRRLSRYGPYPHYVLRLKREH